MRYLATLAAAGLPILLSADALAQVPRGHGVYSRLNSSSGFSTPSGFTIFDPYGDLTVCNGPGFTPVSGVPGPLAISGGFGGTNCVLVDDDGSIWASHYTQTGGVSIYHLQLSGAQVTSHTTYPIGNVAPGASGGSVHQMAWLPDGRIAFSTGFVSGSGLAPNQDVGIFDPATGTVQPVPFVPLPPAETINALAAKRDGTAVYIGIYRPFGTTPRSTVYEIPLNGGGTPAPIARGNIPDGIYQLAVDHTGVIWVSTFNQGLFTLNPATGTVNQVVVAQPSPANTYRQLNALTIDGVSGDVFFVATAVTLFPSELYRLTPGGSPIPVPGMSPPGATIFDSASGMAIRRGMASVGVQAGVAAAPMKWQIGPNPGGPPRLGNLGFSLTLETAASPTASALLLSLGLAPAPIPAPFGATLLLDTGLLVPAPMVPAGANALRTNAALPPVPAMCGMEWYGQSFHLVGGGLASSPAVRFTLY